MLNGGTRDARRTERFLDDLMAADERRASEFPVDVEMDPSIRVAARQLRAELVRVHPSFRFEEALAARLAAGAMRLRAGLAVDTSDAAAAIPGTIAAFRGHSPAGGDDAIPLAVAPNAVLPQPDAVAPLPNAVSPAGAFRRFPDISARQTRPLIMGGVGVASAAISLGAVYVAWRYSHPASGRMGRAARAAHRSSQSGLRRAGVINGILGVVS